MLHSKRVIIFPLLVPTLPLYAQILLPLFHMCRELLSIMKDKNYWQKRTKDMCKEPKIQTPAPIQKGDLLSVNIDDLVHQRGVKEHENSLIARILLRPKVEPMTSQALRLAINKVWDVPSTWKFLPLGRGYYNIHIINHIERERLLARRIWNFKFGIVKL